MHNYADRCESTMKRSEPLIMSLNQLIYNTQMAVQQTDFIFGLNNTLSLKAFTEFRATRKYSEESGGISGTADRAIAAARTCDHREIEFG